MTICVKAATDKRQAQTCDAHRVGGGRRLRRCGHIYATATYVWQDQEAWTSAAADGAATAKGLNGSNDDDVEDVQAKREQGTDKKGGHGVHEVEEGDNEEALAIRGETGLEKRPGR